MEALTNELAMRLHTNQVPLSNSPLASPSVGPLHATLAAHANDDNTQAIKRRPRTEPLPANKHSPSLTLLGYYTIPSMRRLQRLSDADLRAVPQFLIGREGVGEISFLYPGGLLLCASCYHCYTLPCACGQREIVSRMNNSMKFTVFHVFLSCS